MATYDPSIISFFAERLYTSARNIVALCVVLGLVGGIAAGAVIGASLMGYRDGTMPGAFIGSLFGLALGLAVGRERAFSLKLRAQLALCQLQTEINTRRQPPYATPQQFLG